MSPNIFNKQLMIIAGPCSIDENNVSDILEITKIKITNSSGEKQKPIFEKHLPKNKVMFWNPARRLISFGFQFLNALCRGASFINAFDAIKK